jgi:5'-AMP-activated protein kinase, regulatory gamma subunit
MVLHVFLQVKDSDNLVDVALTIIRNEISSVPIFKSLPDSTGMPLLNLATLPGILKCMILSTRLCLHTV